VHVFNHDPIPDTPRQAAFARRDRHYFTGLPCRNGHSVLRFVSNGTCVACMREIRRRYTSKLRRER